MNWRLWWAKLTKPIWMRQSYRISKRLVEGRPFKAKELRFAATARCPCGAGLAYPRAWMDTKGYWDCSAILMGTADPGVKHEAKLTFTFYDIKSEDQPSAFGETTRPR